MSIALSLGNNLTTGGVFKPTAVNNTSCNNITTFAGVASSSTLVLLSTQTASASASISFTTGINSTYDEYIFKFINCHPQTDGADFQFNFSTDGGSNYNVVKTSMIFLAYHNEGDTVASFSIDPGYRLAQSTNYQAVNEKSSADNDHSVNGYIHLFAPSSTTYVKHFVGDISSNHWSDYAWSSYMSGYANTTSAINAVNFKFQTGNIDDGIIKMYGVAKS